MLYAPIIDKIYSARLRKINEANRVERYVGHETKLHASKAGRCILLQQYDTNPDIAPKPIDDKLMRLFRLGDLVHEDVQDAVIEIYNEGGFPNTQILIEREINIERWNVRGFFDLAFYHKDSGLLELVDIKTAATYSWQKLFGRDRKASNGWYEKQIMTYGIGIEEGNLVDGEIKDILHSNSYYKKETSEMKHLPISTNEWRQPTVEYWETVTGMIGENLVAGDDYGCPFYSFECGYCDYSHICSSPHIKKR